MLPNVLKEHEAKSYFYLWALAFIASELKLNGRYGHLSTYSVNM